MAALNPPSRPALLQIILMSLSLVTSAFSQPNLQHFQRNSPFGQDATQEQWKGFYPSISLHDWSIQMLSGAEFGAADPRLKLPLDEWIHLSQSQMKEKLIKHWLGDWLQRGGNHEKRNIVVADDAAFREKSKLLTAMERQNWLNSYMQKLLVVNSK